MCDWLMHSGQADAVLDNDNVKIDFKPLYTCIHIHDTLDAREELQLSYQADRRVRFPATCLALPGWQLTRLGLRTQAQAGLLLSSTASLTPFSLPALSALLEEIVGFFLIESHVLRTTNSFRSEQDVEDLWDEMCERVVRIVDEGLRECEDPEVFLGTKLRVLTFVQTLEVRAEQLDLLVLDLSAPGGVHGLCEVQTSAHPAVARRATATRSAS